MDIETTTNELFALTDEQILEIESEVQDIHVRGNADAANRALNAQEYSLDQTIDAAPHGDTDRSANTAQQELQTTIQQPPITSRLDSPPRWLAERMADPQAGAEARELWNGVEQSRQEAAAFREVFAKPEDARSAAQRSRLLDDIDRAYFTGDSSQRAQLAASMLREDPAAFREMVFAGLRALEETGKSGATDNFAQRPPNTVGAGLVYAEPRSAPPADARGADRPGGASPAPTNADANVMAHYATFERAANEELERTVGSAIERTLDQALPHGHRAENAAMRSRLAATVRQDIEKALQGDRQLGEQVAQVLSARRLDSNARAQIVRLIGDRAQQLVPGTAKRVLGEWTQTTLDSHRGRTNRIETAAARRDVAAASSESRTVSSAANSAHSTQNQNQNRQRDTRSSAQASASHGRKVDYRRFSDEQILDS